MRRIDRRRAALGMLAGAVILAAVIAAITWWGADAVPQSARLVTPTPVPDAQFYRVLPDESQLAVTVDSALGMINGAFEMGPGTLELVREDGGWTVIANLTFDARTLDIGSDQVNAVMRRALEVETYPDGVFLARSRAPLPDLGTTTGTTTGAAQTVDLNGQLELHGEIVDYTIPTTLTREGDTLTLAAQIVIDASDFGVSIPGWIASSKLDADLYVVAQRRAP